VAPIVRAKSGPVWVLRMDNSNNVGGRRRVAATHTVEDQALDQIAKEVRRTLHLFDFNWSNICSSFC